MNYNRFVNQYSIIEIMKKTLNILAIIILSISDKVPFLKRILWHKWYNKLAKQIQSPDWTFMNYGYSAVEKSTDNQDARLQLNPEDEQDRLCIHLYEKVISGTDLTNKSVLEVGSGRGGGTSYIARYHKPAKCIGIDFSEDQVNFSKNHFKSIKNLDFVNGSAEDLPFQDASFDVVINVESSHCYGNIEKFIKEVGRVLKPNGLFLFADLRQENDMLKLKSLLEEQTFWKKIEEGNITKNVLYSLEIDNESKLKLITDLVPKNLQSMFKEFAGVKNGKVYRNLESGNLQYIRLVFRRV